MKTSSFLMGLVTRFIFALINDLSSDFSVFTNQRAFKLLVSTFLLNRLLREMLTT